MWSGRLCKSGSVVYPSRTNPPKRASAEPQQLEAPHPGSRFDDATAIDLEAGDCPVRARRRECDVPADWRVRDLGCRHLQPFDLRILREKRVAEKPAVCFEIVAAEIHRLPLDEIFHRVGRDEAAVVAFRVGLPEGIAVQEQQHVRTEHRAATGRGRAVAVEAIRNDITLTVVVAFRS